MYCVRCRNAAGTAREIHVQAGTSDAAIRVALNELEARFPSQGWRAEWAL